LFLDDNPTQQERGACTTKSTLFHQDDKTDLPVDPADLKQYFKLIEAATGDCLIFWRRF
jgi:hypothetical protein